MPLPKYASTGKPGRIRSRDGSIDIQIDVITNVRRSHEWRRTTTALERGESLTVHRQRVPETMTMDIVVTDTEAIAGAQVINRWERSRARRVRERLNEAQASDSELRVWIGDRYERTPAGSTVWVLDTFERTLEYPQDEGTLMATLTFGESPRFATQFTSAVDSVADELADVLGDEADRGRQSTSAVDAETAGDVAAEAWPP